MGVAKRIYGDGYEAINRYVDILRGRGIAWGILGPREAGRLWDRHILNSAAIADLIPSGARFADVGTGAGLPGLPLVLLRPDLQLTCIEPLLRRVTFLTETVAELGLEQRVSIVRSRAEDFPTEHRRQFDTVTCRALAPLGRLADWCAPLLTREGVIVAIKGRTAHEELARDEAHLHSLGLTATVHQCGSGALSATAVLLTPS